MLFRRSRKNHWERVYKKHRSTEVGWHQTCPERSLELIDHTRVGTGGSIIDIGGGTSALSRHLLDQGYTKVTVLDISGNAIEKAKIQFGKISARIKWIEADITKYSFMEQYDIWHDRAVFHFLIKAEDRAGYKNSLNQALKLNGHLIISTFSPDAPAKCSGLPVIRYSPETLENEVGNNFALIETISENHVTPSGIKQNFIFCRFVKRL